VKLFSPLRLDTVSKASAIPKSRTDWPVNRKLRSALDLCVRPRRASNARRRDSIRDSVPPGRATVSRRMCCGVRSRAA
jgi:hypothetical protein